MRVKSPEYRSSVAIVELIDGRIRVRMPDTPDGHAIGVRLSEIFGAFTGLAILHRKRPKP